MRQLPPRFPLFPYTTLFRSPLVKRLRREQVVTLEKERVLAIEDFRPELVTDGITDRIAQDRENSFFFKRDRKSTRLNSSHRCISYAVFCLKKKKKRRSTSQQ